MKSINQHYQDIYVKSKIETLLFISLFIIPVIPIYKIVCWLNPIGFWQSLITLVVAPIMYIIFFLLYFLLVEQIHDRL